jgi:hypothetical protein
MQNLPLPVDPIEANEMFEYADKDKDNKARKESVKNMFTLKMNRILQGENCLMKLAMFR